jgi:hypothetical protein
VPRPATSPGTMSNEVPASLRAILETATFLRLANAHMDNSTSPELIVQRQLDAFIARDMEAWLDTFALDAGLYVHPGSLLASGRAQMRQRTATRMADPARMRALRYRTAIGSVVIDHEDLTHAFEDGVGRAETISIYVVEDGLIKSASIFYGPAQLLESPAPPSSDRRRQHLAMS